jgi:formylglycine-generating enzyme required for sulfatase activity
MSTRPSPPLPSGASQADLDLLLNGLQKLRALNDKNGNPSWAGLFGGRFSGCFELSGTAQWPFWFDLCRYALTRKQALLQQLADPEAYGPHQPDPTAICPWEVAQVALNLVPNTDVPARALSHQLLRQAMANPTAVLGTHAQPQQPDVSTWVVLVQPSTGLVGDQGLLAQLRLWRHEPGGVQAHGHLFRHPSAALLQLDDAFQGAVAQVQSLLNAWLIPGAPNLAWSLHPVQHELGTGAPSLWKLGGASATAALAMGALYLLRDHLDRRQHGLVELRRALVDLDFSRVCVSAQLGPTSDPADWPELGEVLGIEAKYRALVAHVDSAIGPARLWTSEYTRNQAPHPPGSSLPALQTSQNLLQLAQAMAKASAGLTEHQQALLEWLTRPDQDETPPLKLVDAVARAHNSSAPPASLKAYLLWRYAMHNCGLPKPFGGTTQLNRLFVPLKMVVHTKELDDEGQRKVKEFHTDDLGSLIQAALPELETVTAFKLHGQPMGGKSTLLAEWEGRNARDALLHHHHRQHWGGEVVLFMPVNEWSEALLQARQSDAQQTNPFATFRQMLVQRAPASLHEVLDQALPLVAQPLRQQLRQHVPGWPHGLKIRLCLDGLNEYAATQTDRNKAFNALCEWMHKWPAAYFLPPVLTVRSQEDGLSLGVKADAQTWRVQEVAVLPWALEHMQQYIAQRHDLGQPAKDRLLRALQDDTVPLHTTYRELCATPGILAAQCSVLAQFPAMPLATRRGELMLALTFLKCSAHEDGLPSGMLSDALTDHLHFVNDQFSAHGDEQEWAEGDSLVDMLLPPKAPLGTLLEGLMAQARRMQTQNLVPTELCAFDEALMGPWFEHAQRMGLVAKVYSGSHGHQFRFAHQALQEFLAALSMARNPDWQPPRVPPVPFPAGQQTEAEMAAYFDSLPEDDRDTRLTLRPDPPAQQPLMYVADLCRDEAALVQLIGKLLAQCNDRGQPLNLLLAAKLAVECRERLEPRPDPSRTGIAWDGHWYERDVNRSTGRHPLLQLIRKLLLLNSVDGGERVDGGYSVKYRIGQSGVLESLQADWRHDSDLPAPTAPQPFPPAHLWDDEHHGLEAWCQQVFDRARIEAFKGTGVDVRDRIAFGMALGHLGDNLRYMRIQVALPGGEGRTPGQMALIRLRDHHFVQIGTPGEESRYIIGDNLLMQDNAKRQWVATLPGFKAAALNVTVMEYLAYEEAVGDFKAHRGASQPHHPAPQTEPLNEYEHNPLQPMVRINWHDAVRMGRFMSAHAQLLGCRLPTEVEYEGALRGSAPNGLQLDDEQALQAHVQQAWATPGSTHAATPGRFDFNHYKTRFETTAPVGVFPASYTAHGQADGSGNALTRCSNLRKLDESGNMDTWSDQAARDRACRAASLSDVMDTNDWEKSPPVAVRGGSFYVLSLGAGLAYRIHSRACYPNEGIGLSWVVVVRAP